jgi:hypothetical protein
LQSDTGVSKFYGSSGESYQGDLIVMKLKLVVATMGIMGLVSPVLAATTSNVDQTSDQTANQTQTSHPTTSSVKVHKHHTVRRHVVVVKPIVYKEYKDAVAPAPVCTIRHSTALMIDMTQNMGRALPSACAPGWFNRIAFSGGINVDIGKWGNRNADLMGENYQRFSINDAYLNVTANINDWAKAFASLSYNTATINDPSNITNVTALNHVAEYSSAYSNNVTNGGSSQIQLEQAFMTFGNFDWSPIYLQIGKQFQDFSRYEIHPITRSLTQVMSETLATSGKIGFIVPMGITGSVYVFDDPIGQNGSTSTPTNYGVSLGIDRPNDAFGWDLGAAYMYNLIGVNDIAYNVNQFNLAQLTSGYHSRVGGLAAYGDISSGPFNLGARWTQALQRFNVNDLPKNGIAAVVPGTGATPAAKPWALGVQASYGFDYYWNVNQNVYIGYQATNEAGGLQLPKYRWLLGYGVDVWKNVSFGLEWDHDRAYSTSRGGSGNTTNLVSLRAGVEFT